LEEENANLLDENKMLKLVIDKFETELRYYKSKPFLESEFRGVRTYNRKEKEGDNHD